TIRHLQILGRLHRIGAEVIAFEKRPRRERLTAGRLVVQHVQRERVRPQHLVVPEDGRIAEHVDAVELRLDDGVSDRAARPPRITPPAPSRWIAASRAFAKSLPSTSTATLPAMMSLPSAVKWFSRTLIVPPRLSALPRTAQRPASLSCRKVLPITTVLRFEAVKRTPTLSFVKRLCSRRMSLAFSATSTPTSQDSTALDCRWRCLARSRMPVATQLRSTTPSIEVLSAVRSNTGPALSPCASIAAPGCSATILTPCEFTSGGSVVCSVIVPVLRTTLALPLAPSTMNSASRNVPGPLSAGLVTSTVTAPVACPSAARLVSYDQPNSARTP